MNEKPFAISESDGVLVVAVGNLLSEFSNKKILEAVDGYVRAGQVRCVVDMSKVAFINSIGLNLLILLHKQLRDEGGRLVIAAPSEKVRELMAITKLEPIFSLTDTVEAAIDGLQQ